MDSNGCVPYMIYFSRQGLQGDHWWWLLREFGVDRNGAKAWFGKHSSSNLYQVCGLRKGIEIKVSKRCLVSFSIGKSYKDEVWCNVFPMKECHLLLGRPWLYDR